MADILPTRKYCTTLCFPAKKISKNGWVLESGVRMGEDSAVGEVFQACKDSNCNYVLKCVPNKWLVEHEVKMQKLIAAVGLCMPVVDWWICEDKLGGAIITGLLSRSLKDLLINVVDNELKLNYIQQAVRNILKLHQAGMYHSDPHWKNFMENKRNKLLFIDFDKSGILPENIKQRNALIRLDYEYFLWYSIQTAERENVTESDVFYKNVSDKFKTAIDNMEQDWTLTLLLGKTDLRDMLKTNEEDAVSSFLNLTVSAVMKKDELPSIEIPIVDPPESDSFSNLMARFAALK